MGRKMDKQLAKDGRMIDRFDDGRSIISLYAGNDARRKGQALAREVLSELKKRLSEKQEPKTPRAGRSIRK